MGHPRKNLIGRIAVPLAGLLVTVHLLMPEERLEATASRNDHVQALKLGEADGFGLISNTVYSTEQLFNHECFRILFENRQVWAAFQIIRAGGHSAGVYYVDFRTQEDAEWALENLVDNPSRWMKRQAERIGTVVVFTEAAKDTPDGFLESILEAVRVKEKL